MTDARAGARKHRPAVLARTAGRCASCDCLPEEIAAALAPFDAESRAGVVFVEGGSIRAHEAARALRLEVILAKAGRSDLIRHARGCRLEVDHATPIVEGGGNEPANLRALCTACHREETAALASRRARKRPRKRGRIPSRPLRSRVTKWPKGRKLRSRGF